MAKARRGTTVFSLSFLDIMSCGFGAVVLLFMIINHATKETTDDSNVDQVSEANLLDKRVELAKRNLFELKNSIEAVEKNRQELQGQSDQVIQVLEEKRDELAELDKTTLASQAAIEKLKADIRSLDEGTRRLQGSQAASDNQGDDLRSITGDGSRLYLTGLRMGGKRVLVLVDASASMLAETIVNVLRRRNMAEAEKRKSPKWRRALGSVDWLIAKLPKETEFQIYTFNQTAEPTVSGSAGKWFSTSSPEEVQSAMVGLNQVVPGKGTSLVNAFQVIRDMEPPPDNVFLLTDGLPTMGKSLPLRKTVSPNARLRHFNQAANSLVPGVPVNVILFPMEGDPMATPSFWRLAQVSSGSLISPARDWP